MPWRLAACMASMRDLGSGVGERAEDSAGVEPARAVLAEDFVPVDVAGLELRDGGVAAIVGAQCGAHAEAAFGEVQAVACRAADAVMLTQRMSDWSTPPW